MQPIERHDITGLVLAGGRGSRMGGVDKGLQDFAGRPLARHALLRLAPQVGGVAINANRHGDVYAGFGAPVWPDATVDFAGPLAGMLAGLVHCTMHGWRQCPVMHRVSRTTSSPDSRKASLRPMPTWPSP